MQPLTIPTFVFADIQLLQRPRRRYAVFAKIASPDTLQWLQTHFDDPYVGFKAAIRAYDKQASTIATHCMTCGKKLTDRQMIESGVYCSHKCAANNKLKQAKTAATNLARYNCSSVLQNDAILAKKRQTSIERYGDDYAKISRARASETNKAKYGSTTPFNGSKKQQAQITHRTNFYDKFVETLANRHIKLLTPKQQYIDGCELLTYQCTDCGSVWTTADRDVHHMNRCDCVKRRSIAEIEISEYIKTIYDQQILTNYRQLTKFELDVFLPDINVGFEYNGVYWHSNKPTDYHLNKTNKCKQLGITLYHIFEYDYVNKPNVIKDVIKQAIYPTIIDGSKLTKTIITNSQYIEFVNQNNLQQPNFGDHIVGLVDENNDLVATLSYTIENNNVDIVQYTTKHSIAINSLFEQLFANCRITVKTNIDYQQQIPFVNDGFKIAETIGPQPTYTYNTHVLTERQVQMYNNCNCTYNCGFRVLTKDLI